MRRLVNPVGFLIILLAALGVAFVAASFNANWWIVSVQITESSNSSIPDGVKAQLAFYLTKIGYFNQYTDVPLTFYSYSNPIAQFITITDLDSIRGIAIAMMTAGSLIVLYGAAILIKDHLKKFGLLFALLSLGCFALGIANIFLNTDIPAQVEESFGKLSSKQLTFECGGHWIAWKGYNYSNANSTIDCGGIWENDDYYLDGDPNSSDGATLNYSTKAGAGWWWTYGATIAFMFCAGACILAINFEGREIKGDKLRVEEGDSVEIVPKPEEQDNILLQQDKDSRAQEEEEVQASA
eukprot:TRINITY_DN3600_c0_g1_i1.p1 TRINITY_DN3600_c0_g1~~TRINITY_DN3600_c0_g1_i1.p1  ORF type:complete len:314 (+),score=81.26 TRINITY_DN3600_c0_g1_i1:55-942(+)